MDEKNKKFLIRFIGGNSMIFLGSTAVSWFVYLLISWSIVSNNVQPTTIHTNLKGEKVEYYNQNYAAWRLFLNGCFAFTIDAVAALITGLLLTGGFNYATLRTVIIDSKLD